MQRVFNNAIETGVRIVVILTESKKSLDLQQLIFYDHLTLHFGDVDSQYISLHPSNPFHSTEYIVKRKLVQEGLNIVIAKGIVDVEYSTEGIKYKANKSSEHFLSYFESEYYKKLKFFAYQVALRFNDYSLNELTNYFRLNIGQWKGEFEKEVLFRGEEVV